MTPITFEGCFGWIHHAGGSRGVVICSAHGYEELSTHRIWRKQASRFAEAGMPTLRFDYHGTGDSLGADEDPDRVRAWLDSVQAAVTVLRQHAGVREVTLVGFRLGALLAAVAAEAMGGVDGLALLAPPTSGAAYVRQMRVLARMAPPIENAPPTPPEWKDDLETGGSFLTAQTMRDLEAMDLLALQRRPAARVLMMNRPDMPADPRLPERLAELGADVQVDVLKGYREMVRFAPHLCHPPEDDLARLTEWVRDALPPPAGKVRLAVPAARLEPPGAVETTHRFGPDGRLFAIRCRPRASGGRDERPPILFLNTGANRHIGTCRLTVTLARRLARLGFPSWRIDLAGMGDSDAMPGQPDHVVDSMTSCPDVFAALDLLEREGYRQCVVFGLCSGAHMAFVCAQQDSRIRRLVLVNPQFFVLDDPQAGGVVGWMRGNWRGMMHGRIRWPALLPAFVRRAGKAVVAYAADRGARMLSRGGNGRSVVAKAFRRLSDRGVPILLVYAPQDYGLSALEIYLGPVNRVEAAYPNVRLRVEAGLDHTLTKRWAREHFAGMLEQDLLDPDR